MIPKTIIIAQSLINQTVHSCANKHKKKTEIIPQLWSHLYELPYVIQNSNYDIVFTVASVLKSRKQNEVIPKRISTRICTPPALREYS